MVNSTWNDLLGQKKRHKWKKVIKNAPMLKKMDKEVDPEAIDLLSKMLVVDHAERVTPKEALEHAYFDKVRDYLAGKINPYEEEKKAVDDGGPSAENPAPDTGTEEQKHEDL